MLADPAAALHTLTSLLAESPPRVVLIGPPAVLGVDNGEVQSDPLQLVYSLCVGTLEASGYAIDPDTHRFLGQTAVVAWSRSR